ncbi:MAG: CARDB domain-containing protein [Candidatus Celaenobacter polaris]|nr:CARDB domain-containing protein [Candidatus Celaenobacter polaris]
MKNKYTVLLILLFFITIPLYAQSIIWEEDFETNPGTWTMDQNWSIQSGALMLSWTPTVAPYDLSAISPPINLPSNVGDLIVSQFIDEYLTNNGEVANIELIHPGGTTVLWSFDLVGNNWGYSGGKDISFSLFPYAGQQVQIKFRSYGGSTYNFNYWYIYNVAINASLYHDLAATNISGNNVLNVGQQGLWHVTVKNTGLNTETSYEVSLIRNPGIVLGTTSVTTPINPDEEVIYDFNWTPDISEVVELHGHVDLTGDEFLDNNTTNPFQVNIYPDNPIHVLVWDNDNNSDIEGIGTQVFLQNALTANNITYDTFTYLPADLSPYDAIFVALGIYCVG